ncbi:PDZ domain-containing protein [Draconibacterium sp. IB214405]|uniref:S41 family peptidase n=1 Tax=Draconibacterium sp. IB214405 TaxID=3097352 RepID=UPI002A177537|nr:PDZ domain-containing protein [Draconibacterium sp. IB214405]MDX8340043.1 PDZ domain-containing protein [Draconibacterium sp. IB214405]
MKKSILLSLFFAFTCSFAQAQVDASLFRYSDVSKTHITFVYAGDIWIVAKEGGQASRLSSPSGEEILPKFSPDGQTIAYSANYDGSRDVYTVPFMGGIPTRVTYNGAIINDWHPDGEQILFTSGNESGRQRFNQLFAIDKNGGLATKLPPAYVGFGSVSHDGKQVAFTDKSRVNRTWKRYRGGMASDIYVMNMDDYATTNISNNDASDELPMWSDDALYYLSDNGASKRYNIWKYDTGSKTNTQITHFTDYDVHFPSIGPEELVFEAGGKLYLLNLASNDYKEVSIQVVSDQVASLPKAVKGQAYIQHANISPDGKRAVVETRGEIISVPAEKGVILNLTQSSGSAERYPAWSPDGKMIAYWSDESGEYELMVYNTETETAKKVTNLGAGYRYNIFWSPDAKKVAFVDQTMDINICTIASGETKTIDKGLWMFQGPLENFTASWSGDSRWLTWSRGTLNRNNIVFIYDTQTGEKKQVTSDFYSNYNPVFDPDGKYLYVLTNRSMTPDYSDFDNSFIYNYSTMVAAISLQADTPSLIEPENDKLEIKDDKEKDKEADKEEDGDDKSVTIDFQDMEKRLELLPIDAGNYSDLMASSGKIIYQDLSNTRGENAKRPVVYWDIEERETKTIIGNAGGFVLSADGKKMMISDKGKLSIIDVKADQKAEKFVPTGEIEITVYPKEEWKQIFTDAWRFERDFFYDKNMHGLDWDAVKTQYEKLLDQASSREDVNFVIGELIGEMNASHTYKGGGDLEKTSTRNTGYLGVNWQISNNAYQIAEILEGAVWDAEARSPLAAPGVDVKVGDYILAVNGIPLTVDKAPAAAFSGLGGKTVELTVSSSGSAGDAKKVVVKTISDETRLRHLKWIEEKRKRVDELSDGKIGYIYVRSTGIDGQNELARQFYAQWNKEGLIIDERFNSGGQIPDRFIEMLNRKVLAYWAVRDGHDWQWPPVAHFGPQAMLINGWSGSGGDAFPDYFRKSGLGPLIGSRTWGGLIGISGMPAFVDGGSVTAPTFRMYDPDGDWFKEGHGVDPDIPVLEDYQKLANGVDNQLEEAIKWVKQELDKNPVVWPDHPPYEKR